MGSTSTERRDWQKLIEEYERGTDGQEDFCRRKRINIWTFRSHLYKTRRNGGARRHTNKGQPVRFVEVKSQPVAAASGSFRIKLGAVTVELDIAPSPRWVAELAKSYSE